MGTPLSSSAFPVTAHVGTYSGLTTPLRRESPDTGSDKKKPGGQRRTGRMGL